jgi:hypothetical protein
MYKVLGEKAMAQIEETELNWQANEDSNSIVNIVKHLWGNMLSRWTDFLTTDGEKPWRKRDAEFELEILSREKMMLLWEEGWQCVFDTLDSLTDDDLDKTIYIRNEGHLVTDAINRQIAHYSYHIGQIVYVAKLRIKHDWNSLTIPRNKSEEYNAGKFGQEKRDKQFTDDWLDQNQANEEPI